MRRATRHLGRAVSINSNATRTRSAFARDRPRDRAAAAYVVRRRDHSHSHGHVPEGDPDYEITFRIRKTGEVKTVPAYEGDNLLRLAQRHDIPLEGACEGVTACSTCHIILTDAFFDELEDAGDHATDAEEDMLDQAFGLEPTSRLGCQLRVDARFDGQVVELPEATRNFYVDGHVPQPH
jgi:ferredoxin